jgi:hypothetical protein
MNTVGRPLSRAQQVVLSAAFAPMVGTGVAGAIGTYSNISAAYGQGTALGAVAAGEGATAVLALVLLGLTMLGQSSPLVIRGGLWALPAAASVMSAMAADDPGRVVIYALTPMGMCVSAEGAAFLARRIVVHRDGRDAEAERRAAGVVQALAYHRARAEHHPDKRIRKASERTSWRLARKVGTGDLTLGGRLLEVQRDRVTAGADAALGSMFHTTAPALTAGAVEEQPRPTLPVNAEESAQIGSDRSTCDLEESTAPASAAVAELPVTEPVGADLPEPVGAPAGSVPVGVVAAESARPVRATGRVPDAARSTRPTRTAEELLHEARSVTAGWSDGELTAERIRKAVRTSAARARGLRDTLRAERATGGEAARA